MSVGGLFSIHFPYVPRDRSQYEERSLYLCKYSALWPRQKNIDTSILHVTSMEVRKIMQITTHGFTVEIIFFSAKLYQYYLYLRD
jgi:hypothetical protein